MDALNKGLASALVALGSSPQAADLSVEWLDTWRYTPGVTPFSKPAWPVGATVYYIVMVLSLQRFMVGRKAADIPAFLFVHNMLLCVGSLFLGTWLTYVLVAKAMTPGYTPLDWICAKGMHENGHLQMAYYINSFFKFWEFTDTFLLVLRKRPVAFLHSYHHAATLTLTYVQMVEHSTAQWVPIVLNLWVHVFMYYYYAMAAVGVKIWWKKHLTTLQIGQFVIDIAVISYAFYVFARGNYSEDVCYGTTTAAWVGGIVLFSYLVLFIRFFANTYRKPVAKKEQ